MNAFHERDLLGWCANADVSRSTMLRVIAGGELKGRASQRARRYLDANGLAHLIEAPKPEGPADV